MKIIFKRLKLHDFKGIRDFEIKFNDGITNIYGDNATGKTSIIDAFFWVFFGKNSFGKSKFELMPLDEENMIIEGTMPAVEVEFLNGVNTQTFARIETAEKTVYKINGEKVSATEFKRHTNAVVSEDLFSALLSPVYFGDNYGWQKQRDTIMKNIKIENTIIDDFEFEDVAIELEESGIDKTLKKYEDERKALEKSKDQHTGTRDYLMKKLEEVSFDVEQEELVKQTELKRTEIKEAESTLDALHPLQDAVKTTERNIQKLESEHALAVSKKEMEITNEEKEKGRLGSEYKQKKTELASISGKCSLCGQDLAEFEVEAQKILIENDIKNITAKGQTCNNNLSKMSSELLNLKAKEVANDDKTMLLSLNARIKEIEETIDYEKIQTLREELAYLEKQVNDYEHTINDKKDLDASIQKLKEIMEEYDEKDDIVEAIKEYRTDYAQMVADSLNDRLDKVQIKTFNKQKNGEIKDTFEISMNGVPYSSLNSAGKIEAGVELIQLLSEALDICFPIIIDNKESITKTFDIPNQLITLSVKEGAELHVQN